MKSHAQVVVIGGGVTGCAILYHLAMMGWRDVVLLERKELTSGSSWHAAGNLFALTSPSIVSVLQKYTSSSIPSWNRRAASHRPSSGRRPALRANETEVEALKVMQSRGRRVGIEFGVHQPGRGKALAPIVETDGLIGILHEPARGHVDPASATNAYAKAARNLGATVYRHTPVIETNQTPDGGWQVVTPEGTITAEYVVNAAGLWAREVGALAGITLPLMPVEHHYLVTETIPEIAAMDHELPVITEAEAGLLQPPGGSGPAARRLREQVLPLGRGRNAARFRSRAAAGRPRAHGGEFPQGGRVHAGLGRGRHQADHQRADDLLARPRALARALSGTVQLHLRLRRDDRLQPRAAASAARSPIGSSTASPLWTSSVGTSPASATTPAWPTPRPGPSTSMSTGPSAISPIRSFPPAVRPRLFRSTDRPEEPGRGVRRGLRLRGTHVVRPVRRAATGRAILSSDQLVRRSRRRVPGGARRGRPV